MLLVFPLHKIMSVCGLLQSPRGWLVKWQEGHSEEMGLQG